MKISYLVTVKVDPDHFTDYYAVEDYLTDVVYMHGVKKVTATPVANRIAKHFRKLLGF